MTFSLFSHHFLFLDSDSEEDEENFNEELEEEQKGNYEKAQNKKPNGKF